MCKPVSVHLRNKRLLLHLKRSRSFIYAIAAVISTLVAVGLFLVMDKSVSNSSTVANTTIQVKSLSEDDIANYLKTVSPVAETTAANKGKVENDINKTLSKMSDKEIKDFLKENGEWDEI